jgi:hypothetical protein
MKQQSKIRFVTLLIAALLAISGLVALPHSASAGISTSPGRCQVRC